MKQKNKKVGNYSIKMQNCLGTGGFASTYMAFRDKNYNDPIACKVIQKKDIEKLLKDELKYFIKRVQEEYKALQNLKHPNIVQFLDVEETTNNLYLFFEYCEQDLEKYIRDHLFNKIPEDILSFTSQLLSACTYYTKENFLHRDIKPANILLKKKILKIADFGLATQISDVEKSVTFAGTPHYMAPEILRGSSVKVKDIGKCDVWSVGVTLYELATGDLPFGMVKKDLSTIRILEKIESQKFEPKIPICPVLEKMLKGMLIIDPSERISFAEAQKLLELSLSQ